MAKLKPEVGAKVRLILDFTTRGNKKYRAGLVMRIDYGDREWVCGVWVRGDHHIIRVPKKYADSYFEVIEPAPKKPKDE